VVVFGRGEELIGTTDTASEGAVTGADLSVRPMLRVAELLEVTARISRPTGNDILYCYPTFVPGVSNPGDPQQSTYLSRAEEPRTVRAGIKYSFWPRGF